MSDSHCSAATGYAADATTSVTGRLDHTDAPEDAGPRRAGVTDPDEAVAFARTKATA